MHAKIDRFFSLFMVLVGSIMIVSVLGTSLFEINITRACTPDNMMLNAWEFLSFIGYNIVMLLTGYHINELNKL